MKNLANKVALVTGAANGIGQALAVELARQGAHTVLADVNEIGLEDTRREVAAKASKALVIPTDVSNAGEVKVLCERAVTEMGQVDILANVAGIAVFADIREMELEDWNRILGVNLYGPIHTVTFLLDHMIQRGSGHIINVASGAGLVAQPGMAGYSTSKFGLVGLTEILRAEVARHGIGVTAICPGAVRTNIFKAAAYTNYDVSGPLDTILKYMAWSPERAARAIVKAMRKNRPLVTMSLTIRMQYGLKRLFPSLIYASQKALADSLVPFRTTPPKGE